MHKESFEAIVPTRAKILILGTLPGDLSITQQQYYAHPQNRFWKVLSELYQETELIQSQYHDKIDFLHKKHIALWDVCATANRPGSMDNNITEVIPNSIPSLLKKNTSIHSIYFNGQKAEKLFNKYFSKDENLQYRCLPSTSPANAQFSLKKLIDIWQIIKN